MSLWNQIKGLFGENRPQTPESKCPSEETLIRHETLDRKENFLTYFQQWLASNTKEQMLDWLYAQYQDYCCCGQAEAAIHFMIIPSVSGFVIHFDEERWRPMDFECLFDFFKQQFKQGGYRLQLAEVKVTERDGLEEEMARYYLKPPREFGLPYGHKMDQIFGNIMLTLCKLNGQMINLKLSATSYNDHLYKAPKDFSALMQDICEAY
ncbi:hypothetical protein PPO43_15335 [Saprospira sp. CCB-QB6]|uniref:hypothetical protein n=1 Tax=Saprospira sp. CCB-QB6 TaxID=3023936 RepID=UPI002349E26E|nr:hypothetical protein [Saprospira sp. CCB-QB6]WCL81347.1 hypothetical protein PPO43_15335 [Saprospira sp. CCB-QB6]